MRQTLLAFALAFAPPVAADPPAVTPVPAPPSSAWTELKVPAGEIVVLAAAPASEWDADPMPHVFDAGKHAVFLLKPGEARKVKVTGPDRAQTRLLLVAAAPGPGPKPNPDPKPKPPADPLAARVKAAYDADPETDRAKRDAARKGLKALYEVAADHVVRKTDGDEGHAIKTAAELLAKVREASAMMVGPDALKGVRKEAATELGLLLPIDAVLSDEQRKAVAELFRRLAQILDGL